MLLAAVPIIVLLLTAAGVTEVASRYRHTTDFPIYDADNRIGYIPKPNQSGSLNGQGEWAFNELSMGVPRPFSPSGGKEDILLVGDSLVFGPINFNHSDRLWHQIEKRSQATVWPISAGSWAIQNEVQYLMDHPEVVNAVDRIIFVWNTDDFKGPSSWYSERQKPTRKPISAALHLLVETATAPDVTPKPEFEVKKRDALLDLAQLLQRTHIPVDIWLYPRTRELKNPKTVREFKYAILDKLGDRARVFDVAAINGWGKPLYRDTIHPKKEGVRILAKSIAESLDTTQEQRARIQV